MGKWGAFGNYERSSCAQKTPHKNNAGTILLSSMAYIHLETLVPPGENGREQFLPLRGIHSVGFNWVLMSNFGAEENIPICRYQYSTLGNETNEVMRLSVMLSSLCDRITPKTNSIDFEHKLGEWKSTATSIL